MSGYRTVEEELFMTGVFTAGRMFSNLDLNDVVSPAPQLDAVEGGLGAALY